MARFILSMTFAAAMLLLGGTARAENEGLDDLDKASELSLSASTLSDLAEVIRTTDSAIEKGLDADNLKFAQNLLASALVRRGTTVAKAIFKRSTPAPRWPQFRHVALGDLEKAVKLVPDQADPLFLIARLNLLPKGDRRRATETLNQAIKLWADDPQKCARAIVVRSKLAEDPKKQLADLDEAVHLAPENADIRRARGMFRADNEDLEGALDDLNKTIELAPKHEPTHRAKGLVLAKLKRYDEAQAALDEACRLNPESAIPWMQKARIHTGQKDFKAAVADLSKAHDIEPVSVTVLLLRAAVRKEMDEKEKALADVDAALALRPNFPAAMRLRAALLAGSGRADDAVAELEKLLELRPKDVFGQLQLAAVLATEKKYDEAIKIYARILAEAPDNTAVLRARADALLNAGKQAEAIADYEKLLELQPKDPGTLNNFAWVLATSPDDKLRDGQRALELATKACEITEYKRAYILSTLAAAYAETGDFTAAVKWVEKGLEVAADDEIKQPLEQELESYQAKRPWRETIRKEQTPPQPEFPPEEPIELDVPLEPELPTEPEPTDPELPPID